MVRRSVIAAGVCVMLVSAVLLYAFARLPTDISDDGTFVARVAHADLVEARQVALRRLTLVFLSGVLVTGFSLYLREPEQATRART